MNLHLGEIAKRVARGAHAVLMVDQAGWHMTAKLDVPENITILPLPAKCPELNPTENVWQFLRDNWLSNRVFKGYDDIVALCCDAWNKRISLRLGQRHKRRTTAFTHSSRLDGQGDAFSKHSPRHGEPEPASRRHYVKGLPFAKRKGICALNKV